MPTSTGLIRAVQTERLIAALIPPTAARQPSVATVNAGMRLPRLQIHPTARHTHRVVLIDDHGRVRESSVFAALGFDPGTPVSFTLSETHLIVHRDDRAEARVDPRGRLKLPDAARKSLGITAGDGLLLSMPMDAASLTIAHSSLLDTLEVFHVYS